MHRDTCFTSHAHQIHGVDYMFLSVISVLCLCVQFGGFAGDGGMGLLSVFLKCVI